MQLNTSDDAVLLETAEAEVFISDSDGKWFDFSENYIASYNFLFAVLEVGFGEDMFLMVLEGNNVTVCASFRNMYLDRNVEIQFTLQSITASG